MRSFTHDFYEGRLVTLDPTSRVRALLVREVDPLSDRLLPTDNVGLLEDELDMAEVLLELGDEFGVRFTKADYPKLDGTLDNLIQLVMERVE